MKAIKKIFFLTFLLLALGAQPAMANEGNSWLNKVNRFFGRTEKKTTEETDISGAFAQDSTTQRTTTDATTPSAEIWEPEFDFSEKLIGKEDAPIKIYIFSSLTCPHCTTAHTQLFPYLKEKYADTGEALISLVDFPIDARATTASLVSRCLTGEIYYAFMDTLFRNQRKWAFGNNLQDDILPYAKLAGLNKEQMVTCATSEKGLKELTRQRNLTSMQFKIRSTPTIIVQYGKRRETQLGVPSRSEMDTIIKEIQIDKPYADPIETDESSF